MAYLYRTGWRKIGWSLVLLLGSVNAGCTRYKPVPRVDVRPTMDPVQIDGTPLEEIWSRRAGRGLGGPVAHSDTVAYLAGADRHVMAIDLRNGAVRWSTRLSGPVAEGVASDSARVYAHTERPDGRVYALDIVRGTRIWDTRIGWAASPPALVHNTLIVANRTGVVFSLNRATGAINWRKKIGITRAPAFAGPEGSIIIATLDSLVRLSSADGRVLEHRKMSGTVLTPWVSRQDYLIAGTTDSQVVALHPQLLTPAWSVQLDAPVIGTTLVRGDTIYALTRIGTLYRIPITPAPTAERLIATRTAFLSSPAMVGNWIVAGNADGILHGFNLDGTIAWRVSIAGPVEVAPLALPDGFLAFGGRGDLHRYRL